MIDPVAEESVPVTCNSPATEWAVTISIAVWTEGKSQTRPASASRRSRNTVRYRSINLTKEPDLRPPNTYAASPKPARIPPVMATANQ